MADLGQTFTRDTLPASSGFEPLPAGEYTAQITGAALKDTKTSGGKYIAVQYTILGPSHQGRVIFGNINIRNNSMKAQEIGLGQLNSIITAMGMSSVSDSDQLIGGTMKIKVGIEPAKDGYDARNKITGWSATEGGQLPPPPPVSSGASTPPWKK